MNKTNAKAKWENFWYYYKWHVIIGIFVFIVAATTIYDAVTRVDADISIDCILDHGINSQSAYEMEYILSTNAPVADNNGDGKIKLSVSHCETGRSQSSISAGGSVVEAVQLKMAVGDSSIIITEPNIVELYESFEIYHDLTDIADEMNIPDDRRYMSFDGTKVIAISMEGTRLASDLGIDAKDCYLFVRVIYNDHKADQTKINQFENAKDLAKYMLK